MRAWQHALRCGLAACAAHVSCSACLSVESAVRAYSERSNAGHGACESASTNARRSHGAGERQASNLRAFPLRPSHAETNGARKQQRLHGCTASSGRQQGVRQLR